MNTNELLDRLESDLNEVLALLRAQFSHLPAEAMLQRRDMMSWNAMECFAHLNAQFDYYLPRIELAQHKAKARNWGPEPERISGTFGGMAIRRVGPSSGPRKSRKSINPSKLLKVRNNELKVLLINLEMLLRLLRLSRELSLNRPRMRAQHRRFIQFRLGDLLEYLILHTQRHLIQAQAAVQAAA